MFYLSLWFLTIFITFFFLTRVLYFDEIYILEDIIEYTVCDVYRVSLESYYFSVLDYFFYIVYTYEY